MNVLSQIPAVHQLKKHDRFLELITVLDVSEQVLTDWLSEQIDVVRNRVINNELNHEALNREKLIVLIFDQLNEKIHSRSEERRVEKENRIKTVIKQRRKREV